jgi:hypothetical protein
MSKQNLTTSNISRLAICGTPGRYQINSSQVPAVLFTTLCYAFWLSFARIGSDTVAPTTWPLIWLVFCAVFTMNPLPLYYRASRGWLYRIFGRLLLPGARRVEVRFSATAPMLSDHFLLPSSPISGSGECVLVTIQCQDLTTLPIEVINSAVLYFHYQTSISSVASTPHTSTRTGGSVVQTLLIGGFL